MNRMSRARRTAWLLTVLLLVSLLPPASTESFTSDWFHLPIEYEPRALTNEDAEISVSLLYEGETLADGAELPADAQLTAALEIRFRPEALPTKDGRLFELVLPDEITVAPTDWQALENGAGQWRIEERRLRIEFDAGWLETAPEAVSASVNFPFTLEGSTVLTLAGYTIALNVIPPVVPLTAEGADWTIRLYPSTEEALPENTEACVEEIADTSTYAAWAAEKLSIPAGNIQYIRAFDISFRVDGQPVEPAAPVRVEMVMPVTGEKLTVMHFGARRETEEKTPAKRDTKRAGAAPEIDQIEPTVDGGMLSFDADSFSVFAVVGYQLETVILASDGNAYHITVTCGADAALPEDAELDVREIVQGETDPESDEMSEYDQYVAKTLEALGAEDCVFGYARFFDIHIVSQGERIQPADGSTVHVEIRLVDKAEEAEMHVVHFGDVTEVLEAVTEGDTVAFDASGFSVYGIVDAPEPVAVGNVQSLEELSINTGTKFYLSYGSSNYFTNTLNGNSAFIETRNINGASVWYFEAAGNPDRYYIYTYVNDEKLYMYNTSGNLMGLSSDNKTAFDLSLASAGKFYFKVANQNKWLQHSGSGSGIRLYTDNNNAGNSQIVITTVSVPDDVYGLGGKTYGIAYHDDSVTAAALMAEAKTSQRLVSREMTMRYDVLDNEGILLVSKDSDISLWTFESVRENQYYITTSVGGVKKYLTINGGSVTLADEPDSDGKSVVTATPGTGVNKGKWHFTVNRYSLNLPNSNESGGFNAATGSGATTWMNLVEKSVLDDDDFTLHTAKKVSVSDQTNVYDYTAGDERHQSQVIIYTRVWNDELKKYEFFAVDHDGSLIRCFDEGDTIEWTGTKVNTALWQFTEYHNNDGTANGYYELQNVQYGNYIAPLITGGQVVSNSPIGLNLPGRENGGSYTSIAAWDDHSYSFAGLKVENGRVVSCPTSQSDVFYFAVMEKMVDKPTTVATVDNNQYGITMKMIDFNNAITSNNRDSKQAAYFNGDNNQAGLLSTNLGEDGYPTATSKAGMTGTSLSYLFGGSYPVNHLFLESIHNESGYFEYDSTKNFARLNGNTFTVYNQLGAIDNSSGSPLGKTRTHGQFMPFNDLLYDDENDCPVYSAATNMTDVNANELPDTNSRKGERMYSVGTEKTVDYFFGMEVAASFTQTKSGKDAWGHDIVFEFSGDDDFWFYVDGELVLDLGGVHSAMTGSVNFRTGVVKSSRGNSTLYDIFKNNYETRNPDASAEDVARYMDSIFTVNENGQHVFKDFTSHDLKIFYMERGSGASNLHMRFNLAAVRPGTVVLSKKLSGTESQTNSLLEYYYQIWYKTKELGAKYQLLTEKNGDDYNVKYQDSVTNVPYMDTFTPAGGTAAYQSVFVLKPGQSAEISFPNDIADYYIMECAVNPDIYDHVYANGSELTGHSTANGIRRDYDVVPATMTDRPSVEYENHSRDGAMRNMEITKRLYDENGINRLTPAQDGTVFTFRLYLGNENADPDQLPLARMYHYHVKDPNGNYCRWDSVRQTFVSLGKTDFDDLTDSERDSATFETSINGTVSKIPVDHTVEVRELIIGTQYKVEERDAEIPRGYTLRLSDGYTRLDKGISQGSPYYSTMKADETPQIEVRNQRGWGLSVRKVWTDADFMARHDDIYIAVYLQDKDQNGNVTAENRLDGTLRRLSTSETELYYYFEEKAADHSFSDYVIYEMMLTPDAGGLVIDNKGYVTGGYSAAVPIREGGTLTVGGQPVGGTYNNGYAYSVSYTPGQVTGYNANVRVDKVTNARPGIELYKQDWSGHFLAGAVFTLKDEQGRDVAAATYTSDSDGLITIAYLSPGVYTLTEIEAPEGYVVMNAPMTITVRENNEVAVSDVDPAYYNFVTGQNSMTATVTIRNRPTGLQVRKVDTDTSERLQGVHFALYRQVTDAQGNPVKDYLPMTGYEDLVTDENGILAAISMENLAPLTYYLTETVTLPGYDLYSEDLCFTIGLDGTVTIETADFKDWLEVENDVTTGKTSYIITIPNGHTPARLTVSASKILNGRDMEQGEFHFSMTPIDETGKPIGPGRMVSCGGGEAGQEVTFSFPELVFTYEDYLQAAYRDANGNALFYYVVEEFIPVNTDENGYNNGTGIIYDRNRFLVVVTLKLAPGGLRAEKQFYVYDGPEIPWQSNYTQAKALPGASGNT